MCLQKVFSTKAQSRKMSSLSIINMDGDKANPKIQMNITTLKGETLLTFKGDPRIKFTNKTSRKTKIKNRGH